ncbi:MULTISPECIES: heavy metal-responsive transcriptional regulator [unclassified Lysobacter]|uniref:heavy metal-responsive transcriptional regulator n=1 Tax=unclassified Lysobacter TaxID=2635362 RepID=UPI0006F419BF|nr:MULTISPECIES: heavy metal-responsive transcriptional regulator [unclassified Lysobacter]KQZ57782.1 MerR family transcriptional regulator [Lysobacter sp. Root559]KRC33929.1 MerR family transcriptional regulator [Lysobacter sp. Root76]KRD69263.1 MerR family transcriptional regulator [Lysobacter sp. Root96]
MQIGLLAKRAGVPIDTVRYYERNGILPPPERQPSGYRAYSQRDVERLRFLRRAKALGFTLVEIRDLLELSSRRDDDMGNLKATASEKLAHVEGKLTELTRIRDGLRELIEACPGHGTLDSCPILAALAQEDA